MRVLTDFNSRVEMGVASDEMHRQYEEAIKVGKNHLEIYIAGCKHRVIVENRTIPPRKAKAL